MLKCWLPRCHPFRTVSRKGGEALDQGKLAGVLIQKSQAGLKELMCLSSRVRRPGIKVLILPLTGTV